MSSWPFTPSNRYSWNRWFPATKYDKYKFWSFAFSTQGTRICTSCLTIYNWPLDVSFQVSGSVPLMRSCRLDGPEVGWKQRYCRNTLISGHLLLLTISVICLLNQLQPTSWIAWHLAVNDKPAQFVALFHRRTTRTGPTNDPVESDKKCPRSNDKNTSV